MEVRQVETKPWTPQDRERLLDLARRCAFEDHQFSVTFEFARVVAEHDRDISDCMEEVIGAYVQLVAVGPKAVCRDTGEKWLWRSRKWRISRYMTDSEIVRTFWLAAEIAMRHEHMESFTFKGHRIFDPHVGVQALASATFPENRDDRPPTDPMAETMLRDGEVG